MLSILIPTYNYNALPLAELLEQQALAIRIPFEIICIDDGSFSELNISNQKINSLTNSKFIESKKNSGSISNRLELARQAQYNWLLFIDADTSPKNKDYLKNYLGFTSSLYDIVFGGFAYKNDLPHKNKTLRYFFGKEREEVSSKTRNKRPYKVIISSNFLVKKELFVELVKSINDNNYGLDYLFGAKLKEHELKVYHTDNEVFHLGIDTNTDYLEKVKKAVKTLYKIHKSDLVKTHDISLLKAYNFLKFIGLKSIFGKLTFRFNKKIESNLFSQSPSLFLFDLYRLGYLCRLN